MGRKILAAAIGVVLIFGVWLHFRDRETGPRLVSRIEVEYGQSRQVYEDPEKMSLILNRLRSLGQRYSPDTDPEALAGNTVSIRLIYSDGTQRQHQIKPDRYVRTGQEQWQQADPDRISALNLLLHVLPGDVILAISGAGVL